MCRTKQMHARCFCVRGRACCAAGVCALGVLRAFCGVLCSAFLGALGALSVLCKLYICCFAGRCRCAWCMILRFAVAFACHFLSHSRIARSLFLHEYYKQISAIRVLYPSFVLSRQKGFFVCGRTGCVYRRGLRVCSERFVHVAAVLAARRKRRTHNAVPFLLFNQHRFRGYVHFRSLLYVHPDGCCRNTFHVFRYRWQRS